MKIDPERQREVLAYLGMSVGNNFMSFDERDFSRYVSSEYLNSKRHEEDEVYRMFEPSVVHKKTGLRVTYTTTEGYYGDSCEYRVIAVFILTHSNKRLDVVDVDFEKEEFITTDGKVPFGDVSKGED